MRRLGLVSAATAGSLAEARFASAFVSGGSGADDGSGFFAVIRFVPSDAAAVAGERFFCGVSSSTAAATNVDPATLTNTIGIAQLSTDATQFYLVSGGSAAQTAVPMGTALGSPVGLPATAFELTIWAPANVANTFFVEATNLATKAKFEQTLTGAATVIPQSSTLLAPKIWKTNNATALACAFDLCSVYIETDN
jgi:hypothetical protein